MDLTEAEKKMISDKKEEVIAKKLQREEAEIAAALAKNAAEGEADKKKKEEEPEDPFDPFKHDWAPTTDGPPINRISNDPIRDRPQMAVDALR